jgi:uncharacterized protein Yka (UPF0111/DUF47 family)
MGFEGAIVRPKWLFGRLLQPTHDFYDMLNRQAAKTLEGVRALSDWVNENDCADRCQTVRDLEKEADEIKLDLGKKLTESFITPFDREDIYDLSQLMDEVINASKGVVREIEAYDVRPSNKAPAISELCAILIEGTQCLVLSFSSLKHDLNDAHDQAVLARKAENRLTRGYRQAVRQVMQEDDLRLVMRVIEVYRSLLQNGEKIDNTAEKLLHAIIKMS